jgi:SOS-response transcriptional repressor LexA
MGRKTLLQQLIDQKFEGNQAAFARFIERAPSMVHQWISGHRNIGDGSARHIEMRFRLPIGWMDGKPTFAPIPKSDSAPDIAFADSRFQPRPVLNSVPAGGFKEAIDNIHPDEAVWVEPRETKGGPFSAWLTIENDSMEPDFRAGDLILVDPDRSSDNGNYVIATNGDHHWTFKQLVRDGADWYLRPLNQAYRMILLTKDIHIIGRVIEHQPKGRKL